MVFKPNLKFFLFYFKNDLNDFKSGNIIGKNKRELLLKHQP